MTTLLAYVRNPRILLVGAYDIVASSLSLYFALVLRFETFDYQAFNVKNLEFLLVVTELCLILSYVLCGLYKGVWRFSSVHDLVRIVKSNVLGLLVSLCLLSLLTRLDGIPRSFFPISFILLTFSLGGGRLVYRYFKDYHFEIRGKDASEPVLIVGAGFAGVKIVRDIRNSRHLGYKVMGFIDDDPFKLKRKIEEVSILGNTDQMPQIMERLGVKKVFLAIPSADREFVKKVVSICEKHDAKVKILPKVDDLIEGRVDVSLLRNVKVEDLLGREEVELDTDKLQSMVKSKVILVTGAGGSIGSELSLQLSKYSPSCILLFEQSEFFLYELKNKFKQVFPDANVIPILGDIRNKDKVRSVFKQYRPQIIFHAAAYKHVPLVEMNPLEAVITNALGTQVVATVSSEFKAERFVLISTDKAVNPTNIMGATKRLAEMICSSIQGKTTTTKFVMVRFGNVLGSNGSVIPLFKKQIEQKKDVTVTHPEITRFFMSIPEATQLVMQAAALGEGGEIFVLEMGDPVKIVDLAKDMIKLSGLKLGIDINIKFVGLRPGEKLYEELFSSRETCERTEHGKILKVQQAFVSETFLEELESLFHSARSGVIGTIYDEMKRLIPEFKHPLVTQGKIKGNGEITLAQNEQTFL